MNQFRVIKLPGCSVSIEQSDECADRVDVCNAPFSLDDLALIPVLSWKDGALRLSIPRAAADALGLTDARPIWESCVISMLFEAPAEYLIREAADASWPEGWEFDSARERADGKTVADFRVSVQRTPYRLR